MNPENSSTLASLVEKNFIPDNSHQATARIIDNILDTLDGISGDKGGESIDTLIIDDPVDLKDIEFQLNELQETTQFLRGFLRNGSVEKKLQFFTQEQVHNANFLTPTFILLASFGHQVSVVRKSGKESGYIEAKSVYNLVDDFRSLLVHLDELTYCDDSILQAILKDNEQEVLTGISSQIYEICNEFQALNSEIFRWMFLGNVDSKSPLGAEVLGNFLQYSEELSIRLGDLEQILAGDLSSLPVTGAKQDSLIKDAQRLIKGVTTYLVKLTDLTQSSKHKQTSRENSDLKWLNNTLGPLTDLLYKMIEKDQGFWIRYQS